MPTGRQTRRHVGTHSVPSRSRVIQPEGHEYDGHQLIHALRYDTATVRQTRTPQ